MYGNMPRHPSQPFAVSVWFEWAHDVRAQPDYLERSATDHFGVDGSNWQQVADEDKATVIAKHGSIWGACERYAKEDAERLSGFRAGRWAFESCVAVAEVRYEISGETFRIEHLSSPGLSGIESDAGDDYRREVEVEQLAELSLHLEHFGVAGSSVGELTELLRKGNPQVKGWSFIDVRR